MNLRDRLRALGTRAWFRVVYLALLAVFVSFMFTFFGFGVSFCLAFVTVALAMFAVPYWFGERKVLRYAANGLVIFVIALLVSAALQTQLVLSADPIELNSIAGPGQDPTMTLQNGTVSPFHTTGSPAFTYRVRLVTTASGSPQNFSVWLNVTIVTGFSVATTSFPMVPDLSSGSNDTRSGTWFVNQTTLGPNVYGSGFAVQRISNSNWTSTPVILMPIVAPGTTFFGFYVLYTTPLLALTLGFYLLLVLMWWYMGRARRLRSAPTPAQTGPSPVPAAGPSRASKSSAFSCTNCGADVSEDAKKCPKCGAVFED